MKFFKHKDIVDSRFNLQPNQEITWKYTGRVYRFLKPESCSQMNNDGSGAGYGQICPSCRYGILIRGSDTERSYLNCPFGSDGRSLWEEIKDLK